MARVYLTNLQSDVSGYLLALVNMRNPNPPSSVATAVTDTTNSGDNIQMTGTSGGSTLKWITVPVLSAFSILAKAGKTNFWIKESNAANNAGPGVDIIVYHAGSEGSVINTHTYKSTTEAGTSIGVDTGIISASSTSVAAGDRLVFKMMVDAAGGTMAAASSGFTFDYDGATEGSDGDSFIDFNEPIRVNSQQIPLVSKPIVAGFGRGFYQNVIDNLNALQGAKCVDFTNATLQAVMDDLTFQRNNL
jgi:hypothetical protein